MHFYPSPHQRCQVSFLSLCQSLHLSYSRCRGLRLYNHSPRQKKKRLSHQLLISPHCSRSYILRSFPKTPHQPLPPQVSGRIQPPHRPLSHFRKLQGQPSARHSPPICFLSPEGHTLQMPKALPHLCTPRGILCQYMGKVPYYHLPYPRLSQRQYRYRHLCSHFSLPVLQHLPRSFLLHLPKLWSLPFRLAPHFL